MADRDLAGMFRAAQRALEALAVQVERGERVDQINVYDVAFESFGACETCVCWPGEPHLASEHGGLAPDQQGAFLGHWRPEDLPTVRLCCDQVQGLVQVVTSRPDLFEAVNVLRLPGSGRDSGVLTIRQAAENLAALARKHDRTGDDASSGRPSLTSSPPSADPSAVRGRAVADPKDIRASRRRALAAIARRVRQPHHSVAPSRRTSWSATRVFTLMPSRRRLEKRRRA